MKSLDINEHIGIVLILYFFTGSLYSFTGSFTTTTDIWISIIVAAIIALPLYLMYSYIIKKFDGKNLFQAISLLFGKTISKILIIFYIAYLIKAWTGWDMFKGLDTKGFAKDMEKSSKSAKDTAKAAKEINNLGVSLRSLYLI